eukprot:593125-Prymnesium_polylepis.1
MVGGAVTLMLWQAAHGNTQAGQDPALAAADAHDHPTPPLELSALGGGRAAGGAADSPQLAMSLEILAVALVVLSVCMLGWVFGTGLHSRQGGKRRGKRGVSCVCLSSLFAGPQDAPLPSVQISEDTPSEGQQHPQPFDGEGLESPESMEGLIASRKETLQRVRAMLSSPYAREGLESPESVEGVSSCEPLSKPKKGAKKYKQLDHIAAI